jgi:DNA/RNA endonuclease YhcR with UshA esterase domain
MKKTFAWITTLAAMTWALSGGAVLAADEDKEVTIKGDAKCAHCALNEGTKCQTIIQTEKDGKKETYYLTENDVAKKFHADVCKETKKVEAKGVVTKVDGKNQLKVSKIELAKK